MNTLIKSIVGKFSTVALHATLPFTGYKYDDIDTSRSYRLRSLLSEIWDNRIDEGFHMAYEYIIYYNLLDSSFKHLMKRITNSFQL